MDRFLLTYVPATWPTTNNWNTSFESNPDSRARHTWHIYLVIALLVQSVINIIFNLLCNKNELFLFYKYAIWMSSSLLFLHGFFRKIFTVFFITNDFLKMRVSVSPNVLYFYMILLHGFPKNEPTVDVFNGQFTN